jgi:hypothetical protein
MPNIKAQDSLNYAASYLQHEVELAIRRGLVFATNQLVAADESEHFA